jgi:Tol biopolymer transport system component
VLGQNREIVVDDEVAKSCGARWFVSIVGLAIVGVASVSICGSAAAAVRGCYNGRIAFDSLRNGQRDIYVIDKPSKPTGTAPAPTATPTQLTTGLDDAEPSWSPPPYLPVECQYDPEARPTMIAFQRTTSDGNTNIYAINAATPEPTGKAVQVTHDVGTDTAPAWAPEALGLSGSSYEEYPPIAFERSIDGHHKNHHNIFIANFDGSDETNLTNSSGADYTNPSWAAGAGESWLTFDSDEGGVREVWVMQVSRSDNQFVTGIPREVTAGQPASSNPSWFVYSNYSQFNELKDALAFAGPDQDGGPSQIDIAESTTFRDADLAEPPFADPSTIDFYALTDDACENTAPEWSPTGEFIVYQKTCAGEKSDIYLLKPTADGASGDIDLTEHVGDNENPDWEAEYKLEAEYFPVLPHGRRWRKRYARAAMVTTDGGGTVGGAGTGGGATGGVGSTHSGTGNDSGKPTPVLSAQVKQIIVRGHGRGRVILIVFSVNTRATVVGELRKGRRQVASHRWHVTGGTARLRFRVPLQAPAGMYQIRVIVRAASGPALTVARSVRIGS